MPVWIVPMAFVAGFAWLVREAGDAADSTAVAANNVAKLAVIATGGYLIYKATK